MKIRNITDPSVENWTEIARIFRFRLLPNIITYLVSYRRSIEIWRVCKIYGRRGGAEPSIYFTNPPYFYRPSGTDQISVLFRRGPWIVYTVTKIRQKSTQAAYIYGRDLRAKMWRYDLRGRRHKRRCENKRTTRRYAVVEINEDIEFSSLLNLSRVKAKLAGIKIVDSVSYIFRIYPSRQKIP